MATVVGASGILDIVSSLPLELATSVLLSVDLEDLVACSAVCRSWRKLAHLEYLYAPYLLRKYSLVTHGRSPIASSSSPGSSVRSELLERYRRLSASSYFSSSETLRDLALRDLRLRKQWMSGVPTRKINLNAEGVQGARLLSVVVDPVWDLVITGDASGAVVFWCTRTRKPVDTKHVRGSARGPVPPAIATMALEGEYLVIGDCKSLVHILKRDHATRTFEYITSFPVTSEVCSIHLSGHTVITACVNGEIDFRSVLSPSTVLLQIYTPIFHHLGLPNRSIHYARPFLFTSSKCVSQIYPKTVDPDNRRELWEYSENELFIKNYTVSESAENQEGKCILAPFRDTGELLVAWPDASVYSITGFKASVVALPKSHILAERTHPRGVRSMAAGDGVFVTSSYEQEGKISIFTHEGQRLQTLLSGESITGLAMDPTFFVSVSKDRAVVLWDFSPPTVPPTTPPTTAMPESSACAYTSHSPEPSVFSDVDEEADSDANACESETPPSSPENSTGSTEGAGAGAGAVTGRSGSGKRKVAGENEGGHGGDSGSGSGSGIGSGSGSAGSGSAGSADKRCRV